MKGLLLKDALMLFRQSRLLAALMLALALLSGGEPLVLRSISVLYAALLPINVLAYDERSGWDRVAAVLPYSRAAVVGEKYLLAAVGVLGTTLLSLLSEWVVGGFALPMESIAAALMYACIVLLLTAISLPPMFRFGKGTAVLFRVRGGVRRADLRLRRAAVGAACRRRRAAGAVARRGCRAAELCRAFCGRLRKAVFFLTGLKK